MGKPSQERIVRKIDLEGFLSGIRINPSPKAELEQYTISEKVAADVLYLAAYANHDIIGKTILDLGCGTGRLGLGASFLGANMVVGVDIDKIALAIASDYAKNSGQGSRTDWVASDIAAVAGKFDTVLQNPPFGVQKRHADRDFLAKALEVGCSVYSFHNHPRTDDCLTNRLRNAHGRLVQVEASSFIEKFVQDRGGAVQAVYAFLMTIPRMFDFHTKLRRDFAVDLYVIRKKTG